MHTHTLLAHNRAVDRDQTRRDQLLGVAARGHSRAREVLLQAFALFASVIGRPALLALLPATHAAREEECAEVGDGVDLLRLEQIDDAADADARGRLLRLQEANRAH